MKEATVREQLAVKAHKELIARISVLEQQLAQQVGAQIPITVQNDGVKFVSGAGNYRNAGTLIRKIREFINRFHFSIIETILDYAERIFAANDEYYEYKPLDVFGANVRRNTLARLGYDIDAKKAISGGWLANLFQSDPTAGQVGALMNTAIATSMTLEQFRMNFKGLFLDGAGVMSRHFDTNTFDLFQTIDRIANKHYADELGLKHAIYSGTIIKTTRPFCRPKVGKVFTNAEIEAWGKEEFSGKYKVGYDAFAHCGGHRCRHHLSYISDFVYDSLKAKQ